MKKQAVKILSVLLVFSLMLTAVPGLPAQALNISPWALNDISDAMTNGIIKSGGYNIDYTESINREQFCELIMNLHWLVSGTWYYLQSYESPFTDINSMYSSSRYIMSAYELGIVNGVGDGLFAPDRDINRQEIAKMFASLLTACGLSIEVGEDEIDEILSVYADAGAIDAWARPFVAAMTRSGLMLGTGTNFSPRGTATFEQAYTLANRIYVAAVVDKSIEEAENPCGGVLDLIEEPTPHDDDELDDEFGDSDEPDDEFGDNDEPDDDELDDEFDDNEPDDEFGDADDIDDFDDIPEPPTVDDIPEDVVAVVKPQITSIANEQVVPEGDVVVSFTPGTGGRYYDQSSSIVYIYAESGNYSYIPQQSTTEQSATFSADCFEDGRVYYCMVSTDGIFSTLVKFHYGRKALTLSMSTDGDRGYSYASSTYISGKPTYARLSWPAVDGAASYEIVNQMSRYGVYGDRVPDIKPVTVNNGTGTAYTITLNPVKEYEITVRALDASGAVLMWGEYYLQTDSALSWQEKNDKAYPDGNFDMSTDDYKKNLTTVTFPVWKIDSKGNKYTSTASVQISKNLAEDVKNIFTEIYNGPEKFPVSSVGGWRQSTGEHGRGFAIDLNSDQNYCLYSNGTVVGSFYKPYESPYSITPDGDVVAAFEKYGWVWGADAWSSTIDYMHFSFFGT